MLGHGLRFQGFSLRTKVMVFSALVLSAALFSMVSQPIPKIAFALALMISCCLTEVPLTEFLLSLPRWLREHARIDRARKLESPEISGELVALGKRMGMAFGRRDSVRVVDAWCNAAVAANGTIYLGRTIVEEFDGDSLCGVLAHELAHKKEHHHDKMLFMLMLLSIPAVGLMLTMELPGCITAMAVFAIGGIVLPASTWPFEYRADEIAATYVGTESVIAALERLAKENNMEIDRDTYTHPSISRRIANLRLMELKRS